MNEGKNENSQYDEVAKKFMRDVTKAVREQNNDDYAKRKLKVYIDENGKIDEYHYAKDKNGNFRTDKNGKIIYDPNYPDFAPNNGMDTTYPVELDYTIPSGTIFDRYGEEYGVYVSERGVDNGESRTIEEDAETNVILYSKRGLAHQEETVGHPHKYVANQEISSETIYKKNKAFGESEDDKDKAKQKEFLNYLTSEYEIGKLYDRVILSEDLKTVIDSVYTANNEDINTYIESELSRLKNIPGEKIEDVKKSIIFKYLLDNEYPPLKKEDILKEGIVGFNLPVKRSKIARAFDGPGGAMQFELPISVKVLRDTLGMIDDREITFEQAKGEVDKYLGEYIKENGYGKCSYEDLTPEQKEGFADFLKGKVEVCKEYLFEAQDRGIKKAKEKEIAIKILNYKEGVEESERDLTEDDIKRAKEIYGNLSEKEKGDVNEKIKEFVPDYDEILGTKDKKSKEVQKETGGVILDKKNVGEMAKQNDVALTMGDAEEAVVVNLRGELEVDAAKKTASEGPDDKE